MGRGANGAGAPERALDVPYGASVALVRQGRVFLIRRKLAPFAGCWTLPGGRLEAGETPEACARRELGEELGLAVTALRPVLDMTVPADPPRRLAVFATDRFSGTIRPLETEIADWGWFSPEAVHGLETTPRLAEVLARALELFGDD